MGLPDRPSYVDLSLEVVDGGDRPTRLLLTCLQKRYVPGLGVCHKGHVISHIDGIDMEWRGLDWSRGLDLTVDLRLTTLSRPGLLGDRLQL